MRSRATTTSSAAAGMPRNPMRVDTTPSCMSPPSARLRSSAWAATGMSKLRAYSRARRISCAFATGPGSPTATAPARTISPISASSSPASPRDTAPTG